MEWSKLTGETKVALAAVVLSIFTLVVNEVRNYYYAHLEEVNASIKLKIISALTRPENKTKTLKLDALYSGVKGDNTHEIFPWQKISTDEIDQALYELTEERLVLFVSSSQTYEFASFNSAFNNNMVTDEEQYQRSEAGIKLNIMALLQKEGPLTQNQIFEKYGALFFDHKTKKHSIAEAFYQLIKDEVVLFSQDKGTFDNKSFSMASNDDETDEEQYQKSGAGIKLNIIALLQSEGPLTQTQVFEKYVMMFDHNVKKTSVAEAFYQLIEDGVILFSRDKGTFDNKSFSLINDKTKPN